MVAWTPDELERLKQLAEGGTSRLRIAAKLGRTITAILTIARQNGIPIKSSKEIRKANGLAPNWAANR